VDSRKGVFGGGGGEVLQATYGLFARRRITVAPSVREQVKMFDLFSHTTFHLTLVFPSDAQRASKASAIKERKPCSPLMHCAVFQASAFIQ